MTHFQEQLAIQNGLLLLGHIVDSNLLYKMGNYLLLSTLYPRSSDPFYVETYYIKHGSLLLGQTVYCVAWFYFNI